MNRNLIDFQVEQNNQKDKIGNKNVEITNIRNSETGLLFNIKIYDEEIKNLLIPSKYYSSQQITYNNYKNINPKKNNFITMFVSYCILLPLTVLSISLICATIFKFLPNLQSILSFDFLY